MDATSGANIAIHEVVQLLMPKSYLGFDNCIKDPTVLMNYYKNHIETPVLEVFQAGLKLDEEDFQGQTTGSCKTSDVNAVIYILIKHYGRNHICLC